MTKFKKNPKNISLHYSILSAFVMTLLICLGNANAQTWPPAGMQGSGTSGNPWQITAVSHLIDLAAYVNASAANGASTQGKYYKLMNDINLNDILDWTPIGNSNDSRFRGNFNGNGNKISNLNITSATETSRGLFGLVGAATIQNIGIENCNVSGYQFVGGLVGYVSTGTTTITNCYVTGTVNGESYVGGLIGYVYTAITCNVSNCYTTCNVIGSYYRYLGGLVGHYSSGTISNCYSTGNVIGDESFFMGAGGLIGVIYGGSATLTNCYTSGNVSGTSDIGGLIGDIYYSSATIANCYSIGTINGNNGVGGLIGTMSGSSSKTVTNCYSTSNMIGKTNVGGLIGDSESCVLSYSYATGTITGITETSGSIGGLVGTISSSTVKNCIAANNTVIAASNTTNINRIIGNGSGTMQNNYALNNMVIQNSNGNVTITDGSAAAGFAKTIEILQSFSFYTTSSNWNGGIWNIAEPSGVWKICDGLGLPFLRWENIDCPFVPVTNITGIPTTATVALPLTLTGTVIPSNATNQTITWSIQNAGTTGATITGGNILNTTNSGTAIVQATIVNGASSTTNYTQNSTITVSKATLGGTVSITGNAVFGQILTAVTTGLTSSPTISNLGTLSYQWKRNNSNISGATNATYTLVQADIGSTITVTATAANCTGEVTSNSTATVTKATQTAPAAPTMASNTATSITLTTVSGCEYNMNSDSYQSSPTFSGLTPNTSYSFTQRKAETATHLASSASPTAVFSTNKATLSGTVSITGNAIFGEILTANTSALTSTPVVSIGTLTYQWKRNNTNISGATNATYTLVQADIGSTITVTVSATNCTGEVTSNPTAIVTKATQTAPAAPTMASNTTTSITLTTVSGCEYNMNSGSYQSSPTFSGLTPNTSYSFTQRKAETATHFASPTSQAATFNTEEGTPPVLSGTVSITGNAVFGQTLTAITNLISTPPGDLGEIIFQWKRDGTPAGANTSTYVLVEADINHSMTVTVTAANCTGSVTSNPTAIVTKATQTAPVAPTLNNSTPTSITLNIVSGCEYNINGGAWQAVPTFAGLTPNTSYAFTQRYAETATHFASPASAPAHFTTDNTTIPLYTIVSYVNNPAFGTITPYGENNVEEGNDITFTITPYTGYIIESVLVNGLNQGVIYSYTFENVQADGTIAVVFIEDVGVDENVFANISVYPNPTRGVLNLIQERIRNYEIEMKDVEIYDLLGRKQKAESRKGEKEKGEMVIDISELPVGVYFLKISTEKGEVIKKVVKV